MKPKLQTLGRPLIAHLFQTLLSLGQMLGSRRTSEQLPNQRLAAIRYILHKHLGTPFLDSGMEGARSRVTALGSTQYALLQSGDAYPSMAFVLPVDENQQ